MTKKTYWENKVVLITGGSSGIGLAAAKLLAAAGAHVWLTARRREVLDAALKEVEARRVSPEQKFGVAAADVADPEQAAWAVETVTRSAGVPDVVINSAGITHPGYVQELPLEKFESLMRVNYFGTVHVVKAVLPGMLARGSGHIVNISSMAGYQGAFGYTAYCASKFAVTGFSEALRAEMKPHGIRVSVAFPPDTDTPQLAYEEPFKPAETKAIAGLAKALPAGKVAGDILKQAARRQYLIFPGFDARLLYLMATKLPKGFVFAILDTLAASGSRKKK
ncbi:MAG: short-chain dehydrogenase/reductase [Anaerolineaceae bacterium]|nr:MAG: short-chain dehydrogenase/reductase [Anaerolineaceae bacterium]